MKDITENDKTVRRARISIDLGGTELYEKALEQEEQLNEYPLEGISGNMMIILW